MIKPEQLHEWYLEAIKLLNEGSYNKDANKEYKDLTEEQRYIDVYIASRINAYIKQNKGISYG